MWINVYSIKIRINFIVPTFVPTYFKPNLLLLYLNIFIHLYNSVLSINVGLGKFIINGAGGTTLKVKN